MPDPVLQDQLSRRGQQLEASLQRAAITARAALEWLGIRGSASPYLA